MCVSIWLNACVQYKKQKPKRYAKIKLKGKSSLLQLSFNFSGEKSLFFAHVFKWIIIRIAISSNDGLESCLVLSFIYTVVCEVTLSSGHRECFWSCVDFFSMQANWHFYLNNVPLKVFYLSGRIYRNQALRLRTSTNTMSLTSSSPTVVAVNQKPKVWSQYLVCPFWATVVIWQVNMAYSVQEDPLPLWIKESSTVTKTQ